MMQLQSMRPMPVTVMPIPDGDAGTAQTVAQMWRLIAQGRKSPLVREAAVGIVKDARVPAHDIIREAFAIYSWALRNVRFTRDIIGRETLHSADEILRLQSGDCDDFTILILSLAGSIGIAGRITTISSLMPDPHTGEPGEFTHVFPEVLLRGRWIALDAARRNPAFGRQPRSATRRAEWKDPYLPETEMEYLSFYTRPNPTMGFAPRRRKMGAWSAPMRMTSGPRPYRRMGFDIGAITSLIGAGAGATTQIIAASRGAATSSTPGGALQTGVAPSAFGAGYPYAFAAPASSPYGGSFFGMSPMMLLLVGGGILLLASRRG